MNYQMFWNAEKGDYWKLTTTSGDEVSVYTAIKDYVERNTRQYPFWVILDSVFIARIRQSLQIKPLTLEYFEENVFLPVFEARINDLDAQTRRAVVIGLRNLRNRMNKYKVPMIKDRKTGEQREKTFEEMTENQQFRHNAWLRYMAGDLHAVINQG